MATSKTWTRTLDPDPEKSGPWKTWETAGYGKMIKRPHVITYQHWKSAKKRLAGKPSEIVVIEAF